MVGRFAAGLDAGLKAPALSQMQMQMQMQMQVQKQKQMQMQKQRQMQMLGFFLFDWPRVRMTPGETGVAGWDSAGVEGRLVFAFDQVLGEGF